MTGKLNLLYMSNVTMFLSTGGDGMKIIETQDLFRCIQCDCLTDCETKCDGCGEPLCHGCSANIEDPECAFCIGTDDIL
jgi:hypothetical protein